MQTIHGTHIYRPHGSSKNTDSLMRFLSLTALVVAASLAFLQGCHSGGGAGPVAAEEGTYRTGYFIDSPVEGLEYETLSFKGLTETQGEFLYRDGETVTFSLGGVVLGRASAKRILTPVSLGGVAANTASTRVINIARFLQSLDDDLNAANGIRIPSRVREALQGIRVNFTDPDLDNDAGVQEMFERLSGMGIYPEEEERGLVPAAQAQLHLENTITRIEQEEAEAEETLRNLRLNASIGSPYPYSSVLMIQGESITLQGSVFGGKAPYTYSWRIDDGQPFSRKLSPGRYTFRNQGSYTITFTSTDSDGDASIDVRHVTVVGPELYPAEGFPADSIPTVGIVSTSGGTTFKAGATVTFEAFLNSGNTPLYYGWSVGAAPGNTHDPRTETVTYISPRTFVIAQDITLNTPGEYPIFITTQDTPVGRKGPDQHAASVRVTVE